MGKAASSIDLRQPGFTLLVALTLLAGVTPGVAAAGSSGLTQGQTVAATVAQASRTATVGTQSVGFQIDAAHTGDQPNDPLTAPLTQRWSVDLGGPVSYPVIADGLVFVTAGFSDGHGARLYALDQGSGRSVWGPIDLGGGGFVSGLAYENGRIFTVNETGMMQSFEAANGARLWVRQLTAWQGTIRSAPTAKNGILYIGGGQFTLYAIRESDGSELWHQGTNAAEYSAAAVTDTTVYQVYDCSESEAFDAQSGAIVWHNPTNCSGPGASAPVVYQGRVYARETSNGGPILDAASGETIGQFSAGPAPAFDGSMGDYVFGNGLHAQAIGGSVDLWHFEGDGKLNTAPIVVNGTVYVGSTGGNVYGVDAISGNQVWSANAGAAVSYNDANIGTAIRPPFAGLGAAQGVLVVPATTSLVLYSSSNAPPPASTPPIAYPPPVFPGDSAGPDQVVSIQVDPQHSGRQPNDPLAPPLSPAWARTLGGNISYPLIVDGRVFVSVATVGSGPGPPMTRNLYAIDERTGRDLWGPLVVGSNTLSGVAHLAYDGGRLFALSDDGALEAIEPVTGATLWTRTFPNDRFDAAPVAMNGRIFFSGSDCSGNFYGVRESDGATLWQTPDHCFATAFTPTLAADGTYWSQGTCGVFDHDPANGNLIWQHFCAAGGPPFSPIYNGKLYVQDEWGGNRILDRATGQPGAATGFSSERTPTFDGPLAFYLTGSTLLAEELGSNRIVWTFTGDGLLTTAPILVNGYVYVGSKSGNVYAVEEGTGRQAWVGNAGAPFSHPELWQTSTLQQPMTGLAAADGVLVTPASNRLVAFMPGTFIDSASFHSATSTRQYHLTGSDGRQWVPIDSHNLSVTVRPAQPAKAVLGGNADLWTAQAGYNQDLGVFVSVDAGADQLVAWKESGGFAGTYSPNAAYVHGVLTMDPGKTYRFSLEWKANKPDPGTIFAGAGPIGDRYSPTGLTVRVDVPALPANTVAGSGQYLLHDSDGATWQPLDAAFPAVTLTPATDGTALLQGNADLWTMTPGVNQDLGIFVTMPDGSEQVIAWKESGGFAGTFSPNAAYVQGLLAVKGGQLYTARLKWKANRHLAGSTIVAGAGPIAGQYSPTRLSARIVGTSPAPATDQYVLVGNDGTHWAMLGPAAPVATATPSAPMVAVIGANADLWTATSGVNQDLGIFLSVDGGEPQLLGWKESGGFAGTFSPNAAFAEAAIVLEAGKSYAFSLRWKTNRRVAGSAIYAGAGPADGRYSPTSLSLELLP